MFWSIVRVGFTVLLLGYVLSQISWYDEVELHDGRTGRVMEQYQGNQRLLVRVSGEERLVANNDIVSRKPGLKSVVEKARVSVALVAVLLTLLVPFVSTLRFGYLLDGIGVRVERRVLMRISLESYVFSLVLPGATGLDVYRSIALKRHGNTLGPILLAIGLDRLAGLAALFMCAAVAAVWWLDHPAFKELARIMLLVLSVSFSVLFLLTVSGLGRILINSVRSTRALKVINRLRAYVRPLVDDKRLLIKVLVASLIIQGLILTSVAVLSLALRIDYAVEVAFLIVPVAMIVGAVAPTPQGLGALEGFLVMVLAPIITGGANACLLVAVGMRLLRLVWAVPGALLMMRLRI